MLKATRRSKSASARSDVEACTNNCADLPRTMRSTVPLMSAAADTSRVGKKASGRLCGKSCRRCEKPTSRFPMHGAPSHPCTEQRWQGRGIVCRWDRRPDCRLGRSGQLVTLSVGKVDPGAVSAATRSIWMEEPRYAASCCLKFSGKRT